MSEEATIDLDMNNTVTPDVMSNIIRSNIRIREEHPEFVKNMAPILIHGAPGIGKSDVVNQVASQLGLSIIDVRLAQIEPADVKGFPVADHKNKLMEWFVNGVWPRDPDSKGILFLDEITSADRSTQAAVYELILDRRLGNLYKLPDGWYIVAAGNNSTDHAIVTSMSSALANRFAHYEMQSSPDIWLRWARSTGQVDPAVTGFIKNFPQFLFDMSENQNLERGFPTPRSWERVSTECKCYRLYKDDAKNPYTEEMFHHKICALVGTSIGMQFTSYLKIANEYANVLEVMENPNATINMPQQGDRVVALVSACVYYLWEKTNDPKIFKNRMNGFFRIMMQLDPAYVLMAFEAATDGDEETRIKRGATFVTYNTEMYQKFMNKYQAYLNSAKSV